LAVISTLGSYKIETSTPSKRWPILPTLRIHSRISSVSRCRRLIKRIAKTSMNPQNSSMIRRASAKHSFDKLQRYSLLKLVVSSRIFAVFESFLVQTTWPLIKRRSTIGEIVRFFASVRRATALSTLIHQRRLTPSCGGHAPTAQRTVGPTRMIVECLTPRPGIREQNRPITTGRLFRADRR
jgi:hypothetical protein